MSDKTQPKGPKPASPDTRRKSKAEIAEELDEELEQELEDSFPASDPPSITQPVHPSKKKDG